MSDSSRKQFANIYDRYIDKIYRFIFLKVGSQEIAEDLCSETFLRGWEAYEMKNEKLKMKNDNLKSKIENPGAFLYAVAHNLVVDYYRKKGREPIVMAEFASEEIIDPSQDIAETALLNADVDAVRQVLQDLPDDYQNVIIWRHIDGLDFAEIAELMGRTEEAVRVLLHRALKVLRSKLASC